MSLDRGNAHGLEKRVRDLETETIALQTLLVSVLGIAGNQWPHARPLISQAFNEAASVVEALSIAAGPAAPHLPKAINILEQLRLAVEGESKPKHGV